MGLQNGRVLRGFEQEDDSVVNILNLKIFEHERWDSELGGIAKTAMFYPCSEKTSPAKRANLLDLDHW